MLPEKNSFIVQRAIGTRNHATVCPSQVCSPLKLPTMCLTQISVKGATVSRFLHRMDGKCCMHVRWTLLRGGRMSLCALASFPGHPGLISAGLLTLVDLGTRLYVNKWNTICSPLWIFCDDSSQLTRICSGVRLRRCSMNRKL